MPVGKRPFTEEEAKRLLSASDVYFQFPANIRNRCMWMVEATTGLRIGEVLQLKVRDCFTAEGKRRRGILRIVARLTL